MSFLIVEVRSTLAITSAVHALAGAAIGTAIAPARIAAAAERRAVIRCVGREIAASAGIEYSEYPQNLPHGSLRCERFRTQISQAGDQPTPSA